jgi:hypothetical protein
MTNNTQIEINIIFGQYDQTSIEGFNKDLNAIAEKWGLKTKSTSFSVVEKPKSQVKRLKDIDASGVRRSKRQAEKQLLKK